MCHVRCQMLVGRVPYTVLPESRGCARLKSRGLSWLWLIADIVFMNDVADVVRLHSLDSSFEAAPILHLTWKQRPSYILPESGTHLPSYLKRAPILCHTDVLMSYLEGRPVWCTHW